MRTRILAALTCVFAVALAMTGGSVGAAQAGEAALAKPAAASAKVYTRPACGAAARHGRDECLAVIRTSADGTPLASSTTTPAGYGPAQLQSAYELAKAAAQGGKGMTVALVDAYDDPNAAADLAAYRAQYGLPPCTEASGCFRKVNQEGQTDPLPTPNADWAVEESLDMEMVSAICPQCHIILAEANDNSDYNLAATVATAAHIGATQISNSYGEPEYPAEASLEPFYDQPGVEVTAGAGDSGYGVSYPAASAYVTSAGGTSLYKSGGSRGWSETAWSGGGSGCSAVIGKPAWQHDGCANRTDNDVAAVADPDTPVAIYDTFNQSGWGLVGGTSVSSPIIASVDALLGKQAASSPGGSYWYNHPKNVFAVTSGSNGTCDPAYLCTAKQGYNGPAGNGTPDFTGATLTSNSCGGGFSAVPAQAIPGAVPNVPDASYDNGVAALAPDDVWTSGYYYAGYAGLPGLSNGWAGTLDHWNGSRWTMTKPPMFINGSGLSASAFTAISFDKPSDGWAAGFLSADGNASYGTPIVSRWNGREWTSALVPYPIRTSDFNGVTMTEQMRPVAIKALSPDNVWLSVESYVANAAAPDGSFIEHWNGTAWQTVSFQHMTSLLSFTGTAKDLWVVGYTLPYGGGVILHWNGSAWTSVPVPKPSVGLLRFYGASGSSPDSIWAAGFIWNGATFLPHGGDVPVVYHWDGSSWTSETLPDIDSISGNDSGLYGVDAISQSDAWAVGSASGNPGRQLLLHWNGKAWAKTGDVTASNLQGLLAVSGSSPGNVWLVGQNLTNSNYGVAPAVFRSGCGTQAAAGTAPAAGTTAGALATSAHAPATPSVPASADYRHACDSSAKPGVAQCLALIDTKVVQRAQATLRPDSAPTGVGYGPADLQSAYSLPSATDGSGETVAIVDAYDDPNAEADLAVYRSDWGLPPCTSASGCFTKVNENGNTTPLPSAAGSNGWAMEESLDLDMVSATCPNCHILLVEANSADVSDLGAGVNSAVRLGAGFVSNSYGGSEYAGEQNDDATYYNHPGVVVTASGGDNGYSSGVEFPAASPNVVSVGGTSLLKASNPRGWTEAAWSGTGSGCSAFEPKPAWQSDSGCTNRTDDDVAAVGDPDTGVAVYDSYDQNGWLQVGGTSVGAPLIASTYALAGTPKPTTYPASYLYAHASDLYDVTSGPPNVTCNPVYLCTAGPGYDGPTGLGTPDGTSAFTAPTGNVITVYNPGSQSPTGGSAFSLQIRATDSGSGQTLSYQAAGLPPGLSIDEATGLISGTPTETGSYNATITVTDGTGNSGTTVVLFTVVSPVSLPGLIPQAGYTGQPVLLPATAADANSGQTFRYSATGLPPGLAISAATGTISGRATSSGYYQPVITASDSDGWSGSVTLVWYVAGAPAAGRIGPLKLGGRCLTAPGLDLASCADTAAQHWQLRPNGTIAGSGKCLAVTGTAVALAGCESASAAQQWRTGSGGELIAAASGMCLTGGRSVASCAGSASQRWSPPAGPLVSAVTGMCAAAAGSRAELAFCGNTTAQAWTVGSDGTLAVAGKCLTVAAGHLTLARCAGAAAQQWRISAIGTLLNPASRRCLTDPGSDPVDGTALTAGSCQVSTAGLWFAD